MLFDCLIGNQDRHDQNWGVILQTGQGEYDRYWYLAPTFDHASSFACRLNIDEKEKRLNTNDKGFAVEALASKAKTPFYSSEAKRLKTIDALHYSKDYLSSKGIALDDWIDYISSTIDRSFIDSIIQRFPDGFINTIEAEFTTRFILSNKERILELRG